MQGGGAGIQADLKTMTMNGVYAMSVVTALTAQNTTGVRAIQESTPDFLRQQLDAVFEDIMPDAVKIGMVSSSALIAVIAERLRHYQARHVVVDPVMVATSGSALMKTDAVEALCRQLLPLAALVTPNIPEAQVLSGLAVHTEEDMISAARENRGHLRLPRPAQGRPPCQRRQRSALRRRRADLVPGYAHRQPQHPRHGLHLVQRHRCQPGQGLLPGRFSPAGQGLPLPAPWQPCWTWARARAPCITRSTCRASTPGRAEA